MADSFELDAIKWQQQYDLEADLVSIHHQKKIYWKQRGYLNWMFKGDANMAYLSMVFPTVVDVTATLIC